MSRHVEPLFMALIEGRLAPAQEIRARRHLASCDRCRDSLAGFEQLADDVNRTLRFGVHASNNQITNWWDVISRQVMFPTRSWLSTAILPAILSAVLIALPFAVRLVGNRQDSFDTVGGTTMSVPSLDGTNIPPFDNVGTEELGQQRRLIAEYELTQPAILGSTPAPLIPAPLAPAAPSN